MAKKPPPRRAPAPRTPAPRTPVKSSGGRPAGLFTWIAIGLVVVIVATLVIIKVSSNSGGGGGSSGWQAADAATVAEVTSIPSSVFDTVGINSTVAAVSPPVTIKGQPPLTGKSSTGADVPELFYLGGEYCPFCAAERWPIIIAMSRFGTWSKLGNMESSTHPGEIYQGTQTFTFLKAHYSSPYLAFSSVEAYTNQWSNSLNFYTALQSPSKAQDAVFKKYDTAKYIPGFTTQQNGSIPFVDINNEYLIAGASFTPSLLAGQTRTQIAAGLKDATSPVTDAIVANANYLTAALCKTTNNQPGNVCSSKGVMAAKKAMGIK